jgi:hypothetical protein
VVHLQLRQPRPQVLHPPLIRFFTLDSRQVPGAAVAVGVAQVVYPAVDLVRPARRPGLDLLLRAQRS